MKVCSYCGSLCQDNAVKCSFCQSDFDPSTIPTGQQKKKSGVWRVLSSLLIVAAVIYLLARLSLGLGIDDGVTIGIFAAVLIWFIVHLTYKAVKNTQIDAAKTFANVPTAVTDSDVTDTDAEEKDTDAVIAPTRIFARELIDASRSDKPVPKYMVNKELSVAETFGLMSADCRLTESSVRTVLASLATSRLLFISGGEGTDPADVYKTVSAISERDTLAADMTEKEAASDSIYTYSDQSGSVKPTALLKALYLANYNSGSVHTVALGGIAAAQLSEKLEPLKEYIKNPEGGISITCPESLDNVSYAEEGNVIKVPSNVWICSAFNAVADALPSRELVEDSAFVNITLSREAAAIEAGTAPAAEDTPDTAAAPAPVSETVRTVLPTYVLKALAESAEGEYYIDEEMWKKIDSLEEYIGRLTDFSIGNKRARLIERYIGVYMAAGGSESEAVDSVLATRVLPPVASVFTKAGEAPHDGMEVLSSFLDSTFGIENLPTTAEFIKKFGIA